MGPPSHRHRIFEPSFCVPATSSLRLACLTYLSMPSLRSPAFPCGLHKNPGSTERSFPPSLHKTGKSSFMLQVFSDPQYRTEETTCKKTNSPCLICLTLLSNQALDGLVPVRSIHCCTYTPGLSTLSSTRRLTDLCHERSHLGVGFTLRCFQRLSSPDVATQRYAWRHNWYTIGPSTPVLSY